MPQCNCSVGLSASTGVSIDDVYILKTVNFDTNSKSSLTSNALNTTISKRVCDKTGQKCSKESQNCGSVCKKIKIPGIKIKTVCKEACQTVCDAYKTVCTDFINVSNAEKIILKHSASAKGKVFFYLETVIDESIDITGAITLKAGATIGMGILLETITTKTSIQETSEGKTEISETVNVDFHNKINETFYSEVTIKESVQVKDFKVGNLKLDGNLSFCMPFKNVFNETIPKSGIDVSIDNCVITICESIDEDGIIGNIAISASARKNFKNIGEAEVRGGFNCGILIPAEG